MQNRESLMSRFLCLSAALAVTAATPAFAAHKPSKVEIFGNWAVACDNGLACEMTTLIPSDYFDSDRTDGFNYSAEISVKRAAGSNGEVEAWVGFNDFVAEDEMPDAQVTYTLAIDGREIATGLYGGEGIRYKGAETERIAKALVSGRVLTIADPAGKVISKNSLEGSIASLRYIDAKQGRAGTDTALATVGKKPASAVRAAPTLPVVTIPGLVGQAEAPSTADVEKMRILSKCGADEYEDTPFTTAALNGGGTLVLLSCGHAAYNSSEAAFIISGTGATRRIEPASFDVPGGWGDDSGTMMLVNSYWDDKALTLNSYAKGRGLGDCGDSQGWVWDGEKFRLATASGMSDCRGSLNWLTTWRANVVTN